MGDISDGPFPSAGGRVPSYRPRGSLWCLAACAAVSAGCSQHDHNTSAVLEGVPGDLTPPAGDRKLNVYNSGAVVVVVSGGPPLSARGRNLSSRPSGSLWCLTACVAGSGVCSQHDHNTSAVLVGGSDAPPPPCW